MPKPTTNKRRTNTTAPAPATATPAAKGRLDLLLTGLVCGMADSFCPGLGQHVRPRIEEIAARHLPNEVVPDEMLDAARRAFFAPPGVSKGTGGSNVY